MNSNSDINCIFNVLSKESRFFFRVLFHCMLVLRHFIQEIYTLAFVIAGTGQSVVLQGQRLIYWKEKVMTLIGISGMML